MKTFWDTMKDATLQKLARHAILLTRLQNHGNIVSNLNSRDTSRTWNSWYNSSKEKKPVVSCKMTSIPPSCAMADQASGRLMAITWRSTVITAPWLRKFHRQLVYLWLMPYLAAFYNAQSTLGQNSYECFIRHVIFSWPLEPEVSLWHSAEGNSNFGSSRSPTKL